MAARMRRTVTVAAAFALFGCAGAAVLSQSPASSAFDAARARAEANADLNAFVTLADAPDPAVPASGRLAGLVLAVKNNVHVAGMPNTAGTPALAAFVPDGDAPIIRRLKAEGAQILGKTNMHELAFGVTTVNPHFGNTLNPASRAHSPGGSSGGSAAAVAAGIVPAAIGGDTAASIRLPAALTGIIGFRPSPGRYPGEAITPLSSTRDVPGPMAKELALVTLLDSVMVGRREVTEAPDIIDIRLGVPRSTLYQDLDPEIARLTQEALARLEAAGVTLVEIDLGELPKQAGEIGRAIIGYEAKADLVRYLERYVPSVAFADVAEQSSSPDVAPFYRQLAASPEGLVPADVYRRAVGEGRTALAQGYAALFAEADIDALIFPTTVAPAPRIREDMTNVMHNGREVPLVDLYLRNTDAGSVIGMPGISLPIGKTREGLPVGIELDALPNADDALLAIALALEPIVGR